MERHKTHRNPGSVGGIGILALLDGAHHAPQGGWTSSAISGVCGISKDTVLHHLERLRKYGQVESSPLYGTAPFRLSGDAPDRPSRQIQIRTFAWSITDKGKKRLQIRGGHKAFCPECSKGKN